MVEPEMRKRSDDEYKKYREVLEKRGRCYTVMPYMEAMARGITLSDAQRKTVFESFSELFKSLEALMAPYKLEYEATRLEVAREEEE
jgi:sugar phosphate isomerase/epimerase